MQRIMTSAAIVFAGALLFTGCAAGGGGSETAAAGGCDTITSDVRDISNGSQNALASGGDPADVKESLEGYSERVDALEEDADDAVAESLGELGDQIDEAADFAETLPSDPEAEVDAEAVAEHQTAIQEAADGVNSACSDES
jgi:hypothetical protein